MSCGCVVLAPDTGAVREVLSDGQNGFLYPSGRRMNWVMLITLFARKAIRAALHTPERPEDRFWETQ